MAISVWDGSTDNDVNVDANFSAIPDDNDVIVPAYSDEDDSDNTLTAAAAFPTGGTIASLTITEGGSYTIGTRALPITVNMADATTADVDIGGTGTYFLTPINYDTITVTEAGSAPGVGEYACNLTAMTHAAGNGVGAIHVLCDSNMSVGIGAENGTTTEVETVHVTGGDVTIGSGCVQLDGSGAVDLTISGGNVITYCPLGTVTMTGGTLTIMEGAVASLTVTGGTCYYRSDGTAEVIAKDSGTIDLSQDLSARTFSKCDLFAGATLSDPGNTLTLPAGVDLNSCGIDDVSLDLGTNFRITRGSVAA